MHQHIAFLKSLMNKIVSFLKMLGHLIARYIEGMNSPMIH